MWLLTDVLQMQAAITPTATLWSPPFLGAGPSIVEVSNAPIPVAWWIVGCFFGGSRLGPIEDGTPYQPIGKASQSLQSHSSSTWVGACVGTAGTPNNIIWVCLILWYFKFIFLLKLPCGGIPYTPFSDTPIYISISINQSPGTLLFTSTKPALMDVHDVHPLISSVNIVGFDLFENQDISGYIYIYNLYIYYTYTYVFS